MMKPLPRILIALGSVICILGGVMHAAAFKKAASQLDSVSIQAFYSNSFKALWLIDSATLIALSVIFGLIALKPSVANRWVIVLLALIPAATAILIYTFVGSFIAGHLLIVAAIAVIIGGLQYSKLDS